MNDYDNMNDDNTIEQDDNDDINHNHTDFNGNESADYYTISDMSNEITNYNDDNVHINVHHESWLHNHLIRIKNWFCNVVSKIKENATVQIISFFVKSYLYIGSPAWCLIVLIIFAIIVDKLTAFTIA